MRSLSFILVLLIAFGVHGQTNDNNDNNADNIEKGYPFGKLRILEDGKTEELIASDNSEIPRSNQKSADTSNVQPLPSPCGGSQPSSKIAYSKDKTKYIFCRDEFHYEILTCPDGVEFNEQTNACDVSATIPLVNRCETLKPCLNEGVCSVLSNSTFKCTCRPDWTGDRCETPMNSCVNKPCGPNAECRPLATNDYEQDYVCVCHTLKGYGLNCREAVPNPCLTTTEQFYPFAFSQHAYIQCDGELIYFQPCGPLLYWSQEEKICDRKRPAKIDLPAFLTKVSSDNTKNSNQEQTVDNSDKEEMVVKTRMQIEREKPLTQDNKQDKDGFLSFVPARVANRQQLLANMNNQQGVSNQNLHEKEQKNQEFITQLPSITDSNQIRQDSLTVPKKWQFVPTNNGHRQSDQTQFTKQNTQQKWTPSSTERSFLQSNMDESESEHEHENQPQQNFQQKNQAFGTKQWIDQLQDGNTQNNQRFAVQPQLQRTSQTVQNQEHFPEDNQNAFRSFSKTPQNTHNLQGFQKQNSFEHEQTRQIRPNQFAQTSQTFQNRPQTQDFSEKKMIETDKPTQNMIRLQDFRNKNFQDQEQSWQQRSNNMATQPQTWQKSDNQLFQTEEQAGSNLREVTSIDNGNRFNTGFQKTNQRFTTQPQTWQEKQTLGNPQQFQTQNQETLVETGAKPQKVILSQDFQDQEQSWENRFQTQNQPTVVDTVMKSQKVVPSQSFQGQEQPWQNRFQSQNQGKFVETTTRPQKVVPLQNFQEQEQSWENKFTKQPVKTQTSQVFAFKPTQWSETPKQEKTFSSQSRLSQDQQSLNTDTSFQTQNTQFAFPQQQQQKETSTSNTFGQSRTWPNHRVLDAKFIDSSDPKLQSTQDFTDRAPLSTQTQFRPQNGQIVGNNFETTATTIPSTNKGVNQGLVAQNFPGQTSFQTVDHTQFNNNNQFSQQPITEQRKTFQATPPKVFGSWAPRSS
ncbi:hypothetical protein I4U23_008371 [Adineta vaga]|nr:hypothetical protein I4U23_008371 [Adineta vaga]